MMIDFNKSEAWEAEQLRIEKLRERQELRDMFATRAMQSMIAGGGYDRWEYIAHDAYQMADAMLSEREKD